MLLIAFTKRSPLLVSFEYTRRVRRWFDSYLMISHFKMDDETFLFLENYVYTYMHELYFFLLSAIAVHLNFALVLQTQSRRLRIQVDQQAHYISVVDGKKFREYLPTLTGKRFSPKLKGKSIHQ